MADARRIDLTRLVATVTWHEQDVYELTFREVLSTHHRDTQIVGELKACVIGDEGLPHACMRSGRSGDDSNYRDQDQQADIDKKRFPRPACGSVTGS